MSAFSTLFGAATIKDSDLDAILAKSASTLDTAPQAKRFKPSTSSTAQVSKKAAGSNGIKPPEQIIAAAKSAKLKNKTRRDNAGQDSQERSKLKKDKKKTKGIEKPTAAAADQEDSDDDEETEKSYLAKQLQSNKGKDNVESIHAEVDTEDEDEDEAVHGSESEQELVHETVLQARKAAAAAGKNSSGGNDQLKKRARVDESPAEKDARTTFLGNVPVGAVTDKSMKKSLIKHLISTLPSSEDAKKDYQKLIRLDTIRFRSVPFNAPVPKASGTKQPAAEVMSVGNGGSEDDEDVENHSRKRARRWRDHEDDDEEAGGNAETGGGTDKKQRFLTAGQKRKVAFIKGDVHEKAKSCNAYAVWLSKDESVISSSALASLIVKHANNTIFHDLTLRVDSLRSSKGTNAQKEKEEEGEDAIAAKKAQAADQKHKAEEDKRTLYLGSLDFEETEQAVRDLCERLVKEERGEPSGKVGAAADAWVERVRVVKDAETGLGKGFAYVLFKDRECVDEMLAMDATRVKLSKRKLRMERCKSAAVAKQAASKKQFPNSSIPANGRDGRGKDVSSNSFRDANRTPITNPRSERSTRPAPPPFAAVKLTPRPDIGDTLSSLSKEERKSLKSSDEGRLARRMAKKQNVRAGIREVKQKEVLDKKLRKTAQGGGSSAAASRGGAKDGRQQRKTRTKSDSALRKQNRKKGAD